MLRDALVPLGVRGDSMFFRLGVSTGQDALLMPRLMPRLRSLRLRFKERVQLCVKPVSGLLFFKLTALEPVDSLILFCSLPLHLFVVFDLTPHQFFRFCDDLLIQPLECVICILHGFCQRIRMIKRDLNNIPFRAQHVPVQNPISVCGSSFECPQCVFKPLFLQTDCRDCGLWNLCLRDRFH